jgi:hypothetical protein
VVRPQSASGLAPSPGLVHLSQGSDPNGLVRPDGSHSRQRLRGACRFKRLGHGKGWVFADCAGNPIYAFFPFYRIVMTGTIIVVKSWYKRRSVFKRRGIGVDTTSGSPWRPQGRELGSTRWVVSSRGETATSRVPGRPKPKVRCHGRPTRNRVERDGRPESPPSI